MGYTGWILAARPGIKADDVPSALDALGFGPPVAIDNGWIRAESSGSELPIFDDHPSGPLVAALSGPVLLSVVAHSDVAAVSVAAPNLAPVGLILTPAVARGQGGPLPSPDEVEGAIRAFVAWSTLAPTPISESGLHKHLRRRFMFAEERVAALLETLGLGLDFDESDDVIDWEARGLVPPDPNAFVGLDGYRRPLGWMSDAFVCVDRRVKWGDYRYVPGHGDGFVGIWDRGRPDAPMRFQRSNAGMAQLAKKLDELRLPVERQLTGTEEMVGLVGPLPDADVVLRPASRRIALRDCRFVPGWGRGFAAVWDREGGPDPVARFPGRTKAREAAVDWATAQMERLLASAKLVGPDRWVAWRPRSEWDEPPDVQSASVIVFEQLDDVWRLDGPFDDGEVSEGYLLYELSRTSTGVSLNALPEWSPDARILKISAARWRINGPWVRIPDAVPLTLLATAEWALSTAPIA